MSFFNPSIILSRATRTIDSRGRDLQQEVAVNGGLIGSIHQREKFYQSEFPNHLLQGSIYEKHLDLAPVRHLTLFAPTNYAFLTLPDGILANLVSPGGEEALNNLLRFHVATGKIGLAELRCDKDLLMFNGEFTTTRCKKNGFKYQVGKGNNASRHPEIKIANAGAINGFIHVVDEVMLPEEVFPSQAPSQAPSPVPSNDPSAKPSAI